MYIFSGWNNLKDILRALDDDHVRKFGKRKFVTSHYQCLQGYRKENIFKKRLHFTVQGFE